MKPVEIFIKESREVARKHYVVEQGIPVPNLSPEEVTKLGVFDEDGGQIPASLLVEGADPEGKVRWITASVPVDLPEGGEKKLFLKEGGSNSFGDKLQFSSGSGFYKVVKTKFFTAEFVDPGIIRIITPNGKVIDGPIDFDIRSDARSTVGGLRPAHFEPLSFEVVERNDKRVRIILNGRYRAWKPKNYVIDDRQRYDVQVESTIHADSPVIRFKWCITNHMRFNCSYMWLDRYVLSFPLVEGSSVVEGDSVDDRFGEWVALDTPNGSVAMAFPTCSWLGKGAGIEVKEGRVGQGGIDPPPDSGFGGRSPEIYRKFYYGMSRSFEGALVVDGTIDQVISETRPIPMILPAQYYSDCGALPESGSKVTFGPWKDVVHRTAEFLLDTQWRGTLWYGEWWRETDVDNNLGIEETNSGNSALGPLYHFYRTGDWRFWESAKMSYFYTYDIQFCKREDGDGPYMHTRRFLLDQQEWFHPRYQRVGGMMRLSHFFCDKVYRDKVIWFLRFWGENYVADDGAPLCPNRDGTKSKCTESAMSNFADSLMYAYQETHDPWFLEKARLIGDWVIRGAEEDLDQFCENSNSTRYILRGLFQLCQVTKDQRYIDTFCKIAEWTVNAPTFHFGTHYVAFHFYYASQAYKWCGRREILEGIKKLADWVLSKESKDMPGTYPFLNAYQHPETNWICIYDNKAIVSYLPVLASVMEERQ